MTFVAWTYSFTVFLLFHLLIYHKAELCHVSLFSWQNDLIAMKIKRMMSEWILSAKCGRHITNRKRLPWCELINPYNFFHCQCVSPYVTENVSARPWSSRDLRVSGASRSQPASRKLQCLISDKILNVSVSSRSRFRRSCAYPCHKQHQSKQEVKTEVLDRK